MTPAEIEAAALDLLQWAIKTFGAPLVMSVFGVLTGTSTAMLVEDAASFVWDLLGAIRLRIGEDRVRDILLAEYNAADAAVDAVEAVKFKK